MVENRRGQLWKQANRGMYVEWFLKGCSLSSIPDNEITKEMLSKVNRLWGETRRGEGFPMLSDDYDEKVLSVKAFINSNLSKLGITIENKIGGKLNGK